MDLKQKVEQALKEGYLQSQRLLLRRPSEQDADMMFELGSDEETVKDLTWGPIKEKSEAVKNVREYYMPNPYLFIIQLKENGKAIGVMDVRMKEANQSLTFGYMLNRAYWNQGYMTETLGLIIQLAFCRLGLNRVEGAHYIGNEGSGRVMEKCGMKKEGVGRQEVFVKGRFRDVVHYAILKEEYRQQG